MPIFKPSYNDLLGESLTELVSNTRLTRVSPGSKTRALLETVNRNLAKAYDSFDLNFAKAFLSGATGRYIDLIGELLGVRRLGIETARASSTSQVVKFFVESGTFGDINDDAPITLPAGTLLSTEADNLGVIYRLPVGVVLSASSSEQFISVEALSPGESSNVGSENLKFHNFSDYTESEEELLKVTNLSPILNGANIESDTNYKFRIAKSALSSEAANETAITLSALSVPGVANVIVQNRGLGIGTFKILIKSITPTVSNALLDNVEAAISRVAAHGVLFKATKPKETGMGVELSLTYKKGTSEEEKDLIDEQVKLSVINYVNNLDIGEEFILNELVERVLSVSENIKDVGIPSAPIDKVYLYKETNLEDNKVREELLINYAPQADERVIIEPSLTNPISIARKN